MRGKRTGFRCKASGTSRLRQARPPAGAPPWCCLISRPAPTASRKSLDPDDRRYRYPFTTCVHCGPRYSIIEAVPYDRARTTMRRFPMCAACQAEYDDPSFPSLSCRSQRLSRLRSANRVVGPRGKRTGDRSPGARICGRCAAPGAYRRAQRTWWVPASCRRAQRRGGARPARPQAASGEAVRHHGPELGRCCGRRKHIP